MAHVADAPPPTQVDAVTEVLHGVEIIDPYRWLEDQNSPRTRKWIEEQTVYTRAYLDAIPGRDRIRKRVEELLDHEVVSEPWKVGERYFFLKRSQGQEQPVLTMRQGDDGLDVPLIDPANRGEGLSISVSIYNISEDGRFLAYAVRRGGEDPFAVELLDVDNRRVLPDSLPRGTCWGLVFGRNGDGFYYSHETAEIDQPPDRAVYWHAFGNAPSDDSEVFFAGRGPALHVGVVLSRDRRYLGYSIVVEKHGQASEQFYVQDFDRRTPPECVISNWTASFFPAFLGDTIVCLTDDNAPNGRVIAIDIHHPQRSRWRELVPEHPSRIKSFVVVGDLIFVGRVEDIASTVYIFDLDGRKHGVLPSPPRGTIELLTVNPESDQLFYEFTSFVEPPRICTFDVRLERAHDWGLPDLPFDPSTLETELLSYPSKDGTEIPIYLVRGKGHSDTVRPTLLTGYGGFGGSVTPRFQVSTAILVEHGWLIAIANLRGGSENGEQWHRAAKKHKRQVAFDDFIAGAEWLFATRRTARHQLVAAGGSNAGLLVCAAITQRPDLFRTALCLGPITDMLRYHRFDSADRFAEEYGTAETEEDYRVLEAYSPYHHVNNGVAYPAAMFVSGDADTRSNPMHARKMTARLQAASASGLPTLLSYKSTWGHMPTQPLTARIDALTDRLLFLIHETCKSSPGK
jgi:prolyl oligopeptidase